MMPPASEPLVHIVDDDVAMRSSLAYLAESVGWLTVEYASAEDFLARAERHRPGCLVLDVRMPTMSGLELQQAMSEIGWALPVVFITGHGDVSMAVQAMKCGAADFIEKPFKDQVLLDAIARAVRQSVEAARTRRARGAVNGLFAQLTGREREVAILVAKGLSSKMIGRRLSISDKTVQVHRSHLMEKLAVHSAADITRLLMAVAPELLSDEPDS